MNFSVVFLNKSSSICHDSKRFLRIGKYGESDSGFSFCSSTSFFGSIQYKSFINEAFCSCNGTFKGELYSAFSCSFFS
ncbi:hypothetical protein GW891_02985 [bacterium]|nr:hypothetical protein [bacterium]